MNVVTVFGTIIVCAFWFDCALCFFEFAAVTGGIFSVIHGSICRLTECCADEYIPGDLSLLQSSLETELYNQHLAVGAVQNALKEHIHNAIPEKALAISFHGSTGTGKNHMVNLIVDALYKKGAKSNYVHHYNGHLNFHAKEKAAQYQNQIRTEITVRLGICPRSIFIFDGVDHMPDGMLDALLPFLDYNPRLLSVNPTQAIFIFVTRIGAASIEEQLIQKWQAGTKREETKLEDFESFLATDAYNGQGGFHKSDIFKMNFIDRHIPFLPLEQGHVRKCIDAAFRKKDLKLTSESKLIEMIDEALAHMTFGPSSHNLYSESGCKRVDSKISTILERSRFTNPFVP